MQRQFVQCQWNVAVVLPAFPAVRVAWLLLLGFLLQSQVVEAKLTKIKLNELVLGSSLIAYGRSIPTASSAPQGSANTVWLQPISILKGETLVKGKKILLCNTPGDIESYDLRDLKEPYVIFAKQVDDCYLPIHGLRSVIQTKDKTIITWNIDGQPDQQSIAAFLAKVRNLVSPPSPPPTTTREDSRP